MTLAGERLAALSQWLDASSAPRLSPCGHKRRAPRRGFLGLIKPVVQGNDDIVRKGRYAELLPWDFAKPFDVEFAEHSLPLLISFDQCADLHLPPDANLSLPAEQGRAADRLHQIIGKMEDATMIRQPAPWRDDGGWQDRLCAIVAIPSPEMTPQQAMDNAGASDVDLTAFAVLCVPTWAMARKEVACLRLPFLPTL